ncbi:MAG TPA: cellulose synthase [Streptosporangiaceae bacterium]
MSTYSQIAWLPVCGGLTAFGLVLSYLAFRRRGVTAGLRGVAWSLIPMAAYLTQSVQTLWKMGYTFVTWATNFVFSPEKWAGLALAGLALVLFVVSGLARRTRSGDDTDAKPRRARAAAKGSGSAAAPKAAKKQELETRPVKRASAVADDDDFSEIEKILKNRGIS